MSKGKILELGDTLSLSSRHMNLYFQNRQWQAECVPLVGRDPADLQSWLPYVEEGALALRFLAEESESVIQQFPHLPTAVSWLATADTLMKENGKWWPRLFVYETLRKSIIQRYRDMDTGLHCYVIGATHLGRAAVAAMASIGFSHISLIEEDEDKLAREVTFLKRYVLGIHLEAVPASTLTVQTKSGSLMLNTLVMDSDSSMLKDLSYFNFMNQGGVVVDISECCSHNGLLEEAERADLKIMTGLEVQSQIDVDFLSKIFPDQYITFEDYFESFSEHFEALKNPPSV